MTVTVLDSGKVRITHNLATITVTAAEAETARTDPTAAAEIVRKLTTASR